MGLPRPRRRAAALGLGALLVFAVGTNVQAGWLYVLASLLLAVMVAGWALPATMIRGITVERRTPHHAFQGDEVAVDLLLRGDPRHARFSLSIEDPCFSPTRLFVPHAAPGEAVVLTTVRRASRRGPVQDEPLRLSSSGPFGVATASRSIPGGGRTLVYPRVVRLGWFPGLEGGSEQGLPDASTHRRGIGQDYLGIREYRSGDNPRHVHWPSSARHGSLMVREFERERPHRLAILVDTSADVGTDETPLDAVCSAAASIACLAMERGQPVDLWAGRQGALDALEASSQGEMLGWLAHVRPGGGLSLAEAAAAAHASLSSDAVPVLAFATWSGNDAVALAAATAAFASQGRRPVAVVVDAASWGARNDQAAGRSVDVLSTSQLHDLVRSLEQRCAGVFMVSDDRDLEDCLSRPVGAP
jgi:uncharacterized protein (DUF58 family)